MKSVVHDVGEVEKVGVDEPVGALVEEPAEKSEDDEAVVESLLSSPCPGLPLVFTFPFAASMDCQEPERSL